MRATLTAAVAIGLLLAGASTAHGAARPDLRISSLVEPPSAMQPGEAFSTVAGVENVGRRSSPRSTTYFYLSDSDDEVAADAMLVGKRRTHRLRPGSETRVSLRVQLPADMPADDAYFLVACADGPGRIRESRERRNCFSSAFYMFVRPRSDDARAGAAP